METGLGDVISQGASHPTIISDCSLSRGGAEDGRTRKMWSRTKRMKRGRWENGEDEDREDCRIKIIEMGRTVMGRMRMGRMGWRG